mmetsp:Transcript_1806/g.5260  ORF Transcript_1806/g.5260 Transcript_1806/m.5260 type:complete len:270 (+) Transcript_1806:905-1714(+)
MKHRSQQQLRLALAPHRSQPALIPLGLPSPKPLRTPPTCRRMTLLPKPRRRPTGMVIPGSQQLPQRALEPPLPPQAPPQGSQQGSPHKPLPQTPLTLRMKPHHPHLLSSKRPLPQTRRAPQTPPARTPKTPTGPLPLSPPSLSLHRRPRRSRIRQTAARRNRLLNHRMWTAQSSQRSALLPPLRPLPWIPQRHLPPPPQPRAPPRAPALTIPQHLLMQLNRPTAPQTLQQSRRCQPIPLRQQLSAPLTPPVLTGLQMCPRGARVHAQQS